MRISPRLVWPLLLGTMGALAQLAPDNPDWKESDVPAPPAFRTDRLVPIDMPRHVTVRMGVDPDTLRITEDGIVRYVMVASASNGYTNAAYEGIRCLTGEVKIYARYTTAGKWSMVTNPEWKPLNGNQPSMHALALARQGACNGRAAASASTAEIIRKLQAGTFSGPNR